MSLKPSHQKITQWISPGSRVLDLGCGNGELLDFLQQTAQVKGFGIDIQSHHIINCMKRNIPVYQGNLNDGLKQFPDQSYDMVILSHTLQEVQDPIFLLNELVRVGKQAIITFPNFTHWKSRLDLIQGNIPQTPDLPYEWYDTPNIRVISVNAFKALCQNKSIRIVKEDFLYEPQWLSWLAPLGANLLGRKALFMIERPKTQ